MSSPDPSIEIARQALKRLTARRQLPTPENYERAYAEVAGQLLPASSRPVHPLVAALGQFLDELQPGSDAAGQIRINRLKQAIFEQDWSGIPAMLQQHLTLQVEQQTVGQRWGELVLNLIKQWDLRQPGLSSAMKKEALERVVANYGYQPTLFYEKLSNLLTNWALPLAASQASPPSALSLAGFQFDEALPPPAAPGTAASASASPQMTQINQIHGQPVSKMDEPLSRAWKVVLDEALRYGVVPWLTPYPELRESIEEPLLALPGIDNEQALEVFSRQLKKVWIKTDLQLQHDGRIVNGLASLLSLLLHNLRELSGQDQSLIGQISAIETVLAQQPLNVRDIYAVEASLKDVIYKQGVIKHSLDAATQAMRDMVNTFVSRLSVMTDDTSQFQQKIGDYAQKIQAADNVIALSEVIDTLMADTKSVQTSLANSRGELEAARVEVDAATQRIRELEAALDEASMQVKEDQLTGAYNRRGLDEMFAREKDRSAQSGQPLSMVLLDVDNFKQLNDHYGHLTGDQVLKHLVDTISANLRPNDIVARLGGEEFVLLLPATAAEAAAQLTERLQRQLTRAYFMADQDRLVITFSAGVTVWKLGEDEVDTIERADQAMYRAKLAGKNRVHIA
ncbi:GGDEF domain-containing protein [Rivihabitans pingtungensis]|uniref:GGDEF domain-containing protein n=1 Tax=Rivihabitans pingtungensis TaxID=1054498 RepID=UPI0028987F8D|nr:diguanylate cyclase [Rivihabitans pingtungensis]